MKKTVYIFVCFAIMLFLSFTAKKSDAFHKISIDVNVNQSNPVIGLNLGNLAPEIVENSGEGKPISLSSLRGKLVLIDFWASWCGPCRHENPAVVKAYTKFKNSNFNGGKGFTVYSVSLDVKSEAWKKAIQQDELSWDYHVSDLQGWNSRPAAVYGVTSIPTNFLINEKGIIIQKNLRGAELINVLEKLVIK